MGSDFSTSSTFKSLQRDQKISNTKVFIGSYQKFLFKKKFQTLLIGRLLRFKGAISRIFIGYAAKMCSINL